MKGLLLLLPLLLTALTLALLAPVVARGRAGGTTWYVSASTGDDANDCAAPTTPCATIQAALDKPGFVAGETVLVENGVYSGDNFTPIPITQDVILSGGWEGGFITQTNQSTIKEGLVMYPNITVTLVRFYASAHGKEGIYNEGVIWLDQVSVSAHDGNALFNSGELRMTDGEVEYADGTGIINTGTMVISNVWINDNDGLGISNSGTLTMYNGRVGGHDVAFVCHGIANSGQMWLVNSAVLSNGDTFGFGGGGCNSGQMTLINSTVGNNSLLAEDSTGGGIYNNGGDVYLYNSSIVWNSATILGEGGGIYGGNVTMQNSLIAENLAGIGPDCSAIVASTGYNLIGDTHDCEITPGTGDLFDMPSGVFSFLWFYSAPLVYNSRAIDAGDPTGCKDHEGNLLLADQRGVARVGRCDIGAYEYDPALDPFHYLWLPFVWRVSQGGGP